MAPPHHHYPQGGSTRIYVDENGYPVSASQQPPDGSVGVDDSTTTPENAPPNDSSERNEMDPVLQKLYSTTDASVWAEEFMKVVEAGAEVDEGLMIGWFANAIETAKSLAHARLA